MSLSIRLPGADGGSLDYQVSEARAFASVAGAPGSRIAFAAAHVVCDPLITSSHEASANLDWDATLAYRRHLWSYGLGVAEAMDTAQRGMGLGWSIASKLIRLSLAEARTRTFARRKIFIVSTPTISGASAIEREYEASDQRRYFVPCPHCSHRQWLRFEQLRWEKGRPETAAYVCESCETAIAEHLRPNSPRRNSPRQPVRWN